jgi:hypothetical protein
MTYASDAETTPNHQHQQQSLASEWLRVASEIVSKETCGNWQIGVL